MKTSEGEAVSVGASTAEPWVVDGMVGNKKDSRTGLRVNKNLRSVRPDVDGCCH